MCCLPATMALTMTAPCRPTLNSTVDPLGRYFSYSFLPRTTTPDHDSE